MSDQLRFDGAAESPGVAEAAAALAGLEPARRRSRRFIRDDGMGRPLLSWGIAWVAGSVALQSLPSPWGAWIGMSLCVAAVAVSWLGRHRRVIRGFEQRFAMCWLVLLASSPLLVIVVAPANRDVLVLFLSCLWAVGMLMYGIGADDRPVAAVGGFIVILAGSARLVVPSSAVILVGVAGGVALALLGSRRVRSAR